MAERIRSDFIHHVAGFLARNLPEVEGMGPDVLSVLMESEACMNGTSLAVPSPDTELVDLLASANTILEMRLPAESLPARRARQRRLRVYFRYLIAARRRLERDRKRSAELCVKAGRWDDYARTRYWCFLMSCQLVSLAAGGVRYRFFGTPEEHAAIALRRHSHRIISIRSGVAVP